MDRIVFFFFFLDMISVYLYSFFFLVPFAFRFDTVHYGHDQDICRGL